MTGRTKTTTAPQPPAACLAHALAYAARGWPVLALHPGEKRPATGHGFKDATTDPGTIRAWYTATPGAGVGIHPGPAGLLVLDVDTKKGAHGPHELEALEGEHGALPATLKQRTPSGGFHLVFSLPSAPGTIGNAKLSPSIDVRCAAGYVAAEPTTIEGRAYAFDDWDILAGDVPDIAPAPAWLLERLQAVPASPAAHVATTKATTKASDTGRPRQTATPQQLADLADALNALDPDHRETWIACGHRLKGLGPVGRELWTAWSQKSPKWQASDAKRWAGFAADAAGFAGIFAAAQAVGWVNPASKRTTTPHQADTHTGDLADWTPPGAEARPCFRVLTGWAGQGEHRTAPGVWHFGIKWGKEGSAPTLTKTHVCGPLFVEAITTDAQGGNFGRLLRLRNTLGHWQAWAMPMELLAGAGDELRRELLAMGLELNVRARDVLAQFLTWETPARRVLCVLATGWATPEHDAFVLPASVIGPGAPGVVFQGGGRDGAEYAQAGTLAGWRDGVAALAVGNPVLALALCAAFAGPLLAMVNAEGGGLHLVGDSSTGKTTAVEAAASVWGGERYRRSWRATANGMEGAAALFNDALLVLDEISECDPRDVGAIVYALGNGAGKQRAGRTGSARAVTRWRCVVLSSGERTIATVMAEAGQRQLAGQAVRLLDVPVGRRHGAWDTLHGHATGVALSDAIKRAAARHHGHAGPLLVAHLAAGAPGLVERLEALASRPEFDTGTDGTGQLRRAARRFALLALAGELATSCGATGWPEGEAVRAAGWGFAAWRGAREAQGGTLEATQIARAVLGFIERHGDARFSDANADPLHYLHPVRDRAGWWKDTPDAGRVYLFTADGLREALKGFDFQRALDALQAAGAVKSNNNGERSAATRVDGRVVRLYQVSPQPLEGVGR